MKRREFIAGIGAAAAWPAAARAQQSDRVYRIAVLSVAAPISEMTENGSCPSFVPFFKELRRRGYIEGKNLVVLRFSAGGDLALHASIVGDGVRAAPDLIICVGNGLALALKTATKTIPILGAMSDPVATGIVASLAHPGANITGISSDAGVEIWGKRLTILREAMPTATRFGVPGLGNRMGWPLWRAIREGSPASLGFSRWFSPSWRDAGAGIPVRFCNNGAGAGEGAGPVCLRERIPLRAETPDR